MQWHPSDGVGLRFSSGHIPREFLVPQCSDEPRAMERFRDNAQRFFIPRESPKAKVSETPIWQNLWSDSKTFSLSPNPVTDLPSLLPVSYTHLRAHET